MRSPRARLAIPAWLVLALALALSGCAAKAPLATTATPAPLAGDAEFSLFLIGDAGEPASAGEPVLQALSAGVTAAGPRAGVVFLGDNVYPKGLPPGGDARPEYERRLLDQVNAVPRPAHALFVPGNHDWARSGAAGLTHLQAQQALIAAHADHDRIRMAPADGCPGPVTIDDYSPRLRLVALDTQWWLHVHAKGRGCTPGTEAGIVTAVDEALATASPRHVVVVAHHPMRSSGSHAGHFTWRDHLFPLTRLVPVLWIPLPGAGSFYPLIRVAFPSAQDLGSRAYTRLRTALEPVLRKHAPIVYAGGHEHTLEVMKGDSARFLIVSGAGIYGHLTATRRRPEHLFQGDASGFMRLDLLRDGRVRLAVLTVRADGTAHEAFATLLE